MLFNDKYIIPEIYSHHNNVIECTCFLIMVLDDTYTGTNNVIRWHSYQ